MLYNVNPKANQIAVLLFIACTVILFEEILIFTLMEDKPSTLTQSLLSKLNVLPNGGCLRLFKTYHSKQSGSLPNSPSFGVVKYEPQITIFKLCICLLVILSLAEIPRVEVQVRRGGPAGGVLHPLRLVVGVSFLQFVLGPGQSGALLSQHHVVQATRLWLQVGDLVGGLLDSGCLWVYYRRGEVFTEMQYVQC